MTLEALARRAGSTQPRARADRPAAPGERAGPSQPFGLPGNGSRPPRVSSLRSSPWAERSQPFGLKTKPREGFHRATRPLSVGLWAGALSLWTPAPNRTTQHTRPADLPSGGDSPRYSASVALS